MTRRILVALMFASASLLAASDAPFKSDPPIACTSCDEWNGPLEPFRVFGNTYYVGMAGLSSVLITSPHGHILIDGDLPQSAAQIDAHIRALGFRTSDVRLIVASHEHFDHVGGIAALQRASGARVAAGADAARALERGEPLPQDPQFVDHVGYPRVAHVHAVHDGETLRVGDLSITAHRTPGHTTGGTSWTWRSCDTARCLDMVYADSLTAVSTGAFRYTGDAVHPSRVASFEKSIDTIEHLPCDVILAPHPGFIGLGRKLEARKATEAANAFIDPQGCRTYAETARRALGQRVKAEEDARRR